MDAATNARVYIEVYPCWTMFNDGTNTICVTHVVPIWIVSIGAKTQARAHIIKPHIGYLASTHEPLIIYKLDQHLRPKWFTVMQQEIIFIRTLQLSMRSRTLYCHFLTLSRWPNLIYFNLTTTIYKVQFFPADSLIKICSTHKRYEKG